MADTAKPLLIKRYASRRLYNTETSDYVTLEDIAGFVRAGREVQIVDLKSGDELTRRYLPADKGEGSLEMARAEHGESVIVRMRPILSEIHPTTMRLPVLKSA